LSASSLEQKLAGHLDAFEMDIRSDESVAKGLQLVQSKLAQGKGGIVGN
jgi:hypothetical protein